MKSRIQDRDFICSIAGDLNRVIFDTFKQAISVEYAVGYTGISHSAKRVFASHAWMHTVYGWAYGAHATLGRFYDRVIPHFVDPDDFLLSEKKDDYFLFIGRLNHDKGIDIAVDVCKTIGKRLVVAGQGKVPEGVDYRGLVGPKERAELMSKAKGLFVPSLYLEPFGMVAVEGLISGAPLITTDWGGLSEINDHGITGYKCHTFNDFVQAAEGIGWIDPANCYKKGLRYSIDYVKFEYQKYFDDLYELWGKGWYAIRDKSHGSLRVDA